MKHRIIFVVEDDIDIGEVIEFVLTDPLYRVSVFTTIYAFNAAIAIERPDMVILDIRLPDGDGVDLCKKIRQDKSYSAMPILLMSAHQNQFDVKGSGADCFLSKPFDIHILRSAVNSLLM